MTPILYYDNTRRLMFGKYQGEPVWNIIKKDSQYIRYCLKEVEQFKLTDKEQSYLDKQLPDMLEWKDGHKVFSKGEHKGRKLWDVISSNPQYIKWCYKEMEDFTLSDKELDYLRKKLSWDEYQKSRRIRNAIYWSGGYRGIGPAGYGVGDRNLYG